MPQAPKPSITAAERRKFEQARDAATLQLLFKAARLANQKALAQATPDPPGLGSRVRAAHTALLPHLDFEGIRLTDLAARVGVTKQAVGQLVDDLHQLGMVEKVDDPQDRRAKRIRFSRRGFAALMHGLGVLRGIEDGLRATVGDRRMRELHETLQLVIRALDDAAPGAPTGRAP